MNFELTAKGERAEGWGGGGVRAGLNNFVKKKKNSVLVLRMWRVRRCVSVFRGPPQTPRTVSEDSSSVGVYSVHL